MELNMRRNKEKEEELRRLEDTDNYKELADRYKAELEETQRQREQEEALDEARKFRNEVIDSFEDEKTREAAKRLIAENELALSWGDADSYEAAREQLNKQLSTLRDVVNPAQPQPEVDANNPAPQGEAQIDRAQAIEEAARNRNFSDVLASIPSVAAQIENLDK
jgi:chromosome segregation ATPase